MPQIQKISFDHSSILSIEKEKSSLAAKIYRLVTVILPSLAILFYYAWTTSSIFEKNRIGRLTAEAIEENNLKLLTALQNIGVNFNHVKCWAPQRYHDVSVWQCAIRQGVSCETIEALCHYQVNIDAKTTEGSPLHLAVRAVMRASDKEAQERTEILSCLLEKKAQKTQPDHLGNTPLHTLALELNPDNQKRIFALWDLLFEEEEEHLEIKNQENQTVLDILKHQNTLLSFSTETKQWIIELVEKQELKKTKRDTK